MEESECCGAEIKWTDICTECGEHTEPSRQQNNGNRSLFVQYLTVKT